MGKHTYNISSLPEESEETPEVEEELLTLTPEKLHDVVALDSLNVRRQTIAETLSAAQEVVGKELAPMEGDDKEFAEALASRLLNALENLKQQSDLMYGDIQSKAYQAFLEKYGVATDGEDLQPE